MLQGSAMLSRPWVKRVPHVVDTLLLVSALYLAFSWHISPFEQPWLMAKILALPLYIATGIVALRLGRSRKIRLMAWLAGLFTFLYMVSVALSKSALGWFAYV